MSRCFLIPSRNRSASAWTRFAHDHDEVETRFLDNFHEIDDDNIQQFHDAGLSDLDAKTDDYSPEDNDLLQDYFNSFNDMFFFSALSGDRCGLRMVCKYDENGHRDSEWLDNRRSEGLDGSASDRRPNKLGRPCKCRVSAPKLRRNLLHEMVHAFIHVYTCYCNRCKRSFETEDGQYGHGSTWHAMATELEEFVKDKLDLDVDLGILPAMVEEWQSTGADLDQVDLRGLGSDDVEDMVNGPRDSDQECCTSSEDDSGSFESSSEDGIGYLHSDDDSSDKSDESSSDGNDAYCSI
ncbi:hypothetical protein BDZ45DRAFT_753689 [Acephala macrosclerotiorum]|nr:hypothetical protein BDZ45DRAFT_753689 [Acephala macrosclerotiorum]